MHVYIFGAGASKDFTKNLHLPSPLSNELFDEKYGKYFQSINVHQNYIAKYNDKKDCKSLEEWLTDEWNDDSKLLYGLQKINFFGRMTLYIWYLFTVISQLDGHNTYKELLIKLNEKKINFGCISFNYDTFLDQAYSDFSSLTSLEEYKKINLIKPHGSINWFLHKRVDDESNLTKQQDIQTVLSRIAELYYERSHDITDIARLKIISPKSTILNQNILMNLVDNIYREFHTIFYPLVLAPITQKLYQYFDGFQEYVDQGNLLCKDATDIFCIGYQANDSLIFDMLKNAEKKPKFHVIGKSKDSVNRIMNKIITHESLKEKLVEGQKWTDGFKSFTDSKEFEQLIG